MIKNLKANILTKRTSPTKKNTKSFGKHCLIVGLFAICLIFILSPAVYSQSCLNAISVWSLKVLPCLLPFFIITKMIIGLISPKQTKLDKLFYKIYHTPATSSTIFLLSILSGYPMGAKMIADMHEKGIYSSKDAKRMLAFCSISGPMFMIGSVGMAILGSYSAGLIILVSNLIACLINGLIYRGKKTEQVSAPISAPAPTNSILAESVYDALISILLVGTYMVLSFLIIDMLNNLQILNCICSIFGNNLEIVKAILSGTIEITRGIIEVNNCQLTMQIKTILTSGLIGFGGFCIMFQSMSFLKKLKIKFNFVLLQKFTQGILAGLTALLLTLMFGF